MCKRLCPLLVCPSLLPCFCSWLCPWLWPLLLPVPFAITLVPVLALAFARAFTGDVFDVHRTSHRVWRLCVGFVSDVSRCPCLVGAQEGLEGDTQLVVFTLEQLSVHQQIVFVFRRCVPYHHADLYIVACFSNTQLGVPTTSTDLRTLAGDLPPGCSTACNIANQVSPRFEPVLVWHSLYQSQTSSCSHTVANKAYGVWLQVRLVSGDSSLQVGVFAVGCGLCIQKECYASLSTKVRWFSSLNRNSCQMEQASLPTSTSLTLQSL